MNRPTRTRNIALAIAVLGFCSLCVAFLGLAPEQWGPIPFFAAGLITLPVATIFALMSHSEVRSLHRLERGEDLIGQWRITPQEWQTFVALNAEWHEQPGVYANVLDLKQTAPPEGLEIVATSESVRVGQDFHDLRQLCSTFHSVKWLATKLPTIEILGRIQGRYTSYPRALRIPINPASQKAAMDVHAAWSYRFLLKSAGSGRIRNPLRARNIAAALCAISLVLLLLPFVLTDSSETNWTDLLVSNLYGPMLGLGLIGTVLAGLAALVFHFREGKNYRAFLRQASVRWTIDPDAWQAFLEHDRERRAQPDAAFNFLSLPRKVSSSGVEIIAGEQGLMVDRELFLFPVIATGDKIQPVWREGPPLGLEVWAVFVTAGSSGSFTLRFPVDPGVRPALQQVCEKWRGA